MKGLRKKNMIKCIFIVKKVIVYLKLLIKN